MGYGYGGIVSPKKRHIRVSHRQDGVRTIFHSAHSMGVYHITCIMKSAWYYCSALCDSRKVRSLRFGVTRVVNRIVR